MSNKHIQYHTHYRCQTRLPRREHQRRSDNTMLTNVRMYADRKTDLFLIERSGDGQRRKAVEIHDEKT